MWSNWQVLYNTVAFITSVFVLITVMHEAWNNKENLSDVYWRHDSKIRFPFQILELSFVIELLHLWMGVQKFGEHVIVNWIINLFVMYFVLDVSPHVSNLIHQHLYPQF